MTGEPPGPRRTEEERTEEERTEEERTEEETAPGPSAETRPTYGFSITRPWKGLFLVLVISAAIVVVWLLESFSDGRQPSRPEPGPARIEDSNRN